MESGQKKAINFHKLWRIFLNHIKDLNSTIIIIDGLDECENLSNLIEIFKFFANFHHVVMIFISRKKAFFYKLFHQNDLFEIMAKNVNSNVKVFVKTMINASFCFLHSFLRDLIIEQFCESHKNMFLWIYLMWKKFKSCIVVFEIQKTLQQLSIELNAVFANIFKRFQKSFDKSTFRLCFKVLTWIVIVIVNVDPLKLSILTYWFTNNNFWKLKNLNKFWHFIIKWKLSLALFKWLFF